MEAWARWRRSSEYEDLLAEERVLGDKLRAGPDGVDANRAHQRCRSADGPQHVLDGPATFVGASTDGGRDGLGQPVQHAGLLSHRVLGSRRAGHTVQSTEADSPEAEALIVRVDVASSQYGGLLRVSRAQERGLARTISWFAGRSSNVSFWPPCVTG